MITSWALGRFDDGLCWRHSTMCLEPQNQEIDAYGVPGTPRNSREYAGNVRSGYPPRAGGSAFGELRRVLDLGSGHVIITADETDGQCWKDKHGPPDFRLRPS